MYSFALHPPNHTVNIVSMRIIYHTTWSLNKFGLYSQSWFISHIATHLLITTKMQYVNKSQYSDLNGPNTSSVCCFATIVYCVELILTHRLMFLKLIYKSTKTLALIPTGSPTQGPDTISVSQVLWSSCGPVSSIHARWFVIICITVYT